MDTHEKNLVLIGAKVRQPVREVIEDMAKKEDRSVSKIVAKLLESHPEIVPLLEEQDKSPLPVAA
jgi:hypothetical protein